MKTIAVFFADGFEDIEALSPVDYLRRANLDVITVAVPSSTTRKEKVVTSSHKVPMYMDMTLKEYLKKYSENIPDCVVYPGGGMGAINLSNCPELIDHLEKAWQNDKYVAAICAAPAVVLGKTSIPDGKKWTCYPGMQTESNPAYIANYSDEVFITDGKLITSRGPGAAEQFSMELVRILAGQDVYEKIHKGSVQR